MTLWGESLPVIAATGVSHFDIQKRAGAAALSGTWDLWFSASQSWATLPDDPVTLSWVVEVASGSGTVTASDGRATNLVTVPTLTALGSFGANPGQLVIPSTLTVADLIAFPSAPFLRLSGAGIVVQQVKLRVWPINGPPGGWSAPYQADTAERAAAVAGGWSTGSDSFQEVLADGVTVRSAEDNLATVQAMVRDVIAASEFQLINPPNAFTDGQYFGAVMSASGFQEAGFPTNNNGIAQGGVGVGYFIREPVPLWNFEPPGEFGVDWVYPPDEVANDPSAVYLVAGDPLGGALAWGQDSFTVSMSATGSPPEPVAGLFTVGMTASAGVDPDGAPIPPMLSAAVDTFVPATLPDTTDLTLIEPGSDVSAVRVVIWHVGHLAEIPVAYITSGGEQYSIGGTSAVAWNGLYDGTDVTPVTYLYTPPPFRYWTGTVPEKFTRIMQRGDGLGMGSGRVFNTGTRQASSKVFGTY